MKLTCSNCNRHPWAPSSLWEWSKLTDTVGRLTTTSTLDLSIPKYTVLGFCSLVEVTAVHHKGYNVFFMKLIPLLGIKLHM